MPWRPGSLPSLCSPPGAAGPRLAGPGYWGAQQSLFMWPRPRAAGEMVSVGHADRIPAPAGNAQKTQLLMSQHRWGAERPAPRQPLAAYTNWQTARISPSLVSCHRRQTPRRPRLGPGRPPRPPPWPSLAVPTSSQSSHCHRALCCGVPGFPPGPPDHPRHTLTEGEAHVRVTC